MSTASRRFTSIFVSLVLGASLTLVAVPARAATTIVVTTDADENNNDSDCSLREAIIAANTGGGPTACDAPPPANVITLPAGTYNLTIAGDKEDAAATGDLDITGDVTILGAGAATTIIDQNASDRVVDVLFGPTANISGVTIQGGDVTANNCSGDHTCGTGGGIFNNGTLILRDSIVTNNTNAGFNFLSGGGIETLGALSLFNTTVTGNTSTGAGSQGGGIGTFLGSVSLTDSTVSGNSAGGAGGGIGNNDAQLTMVRSTVSGNTSGAGGGGGIINRNGGTMDLSNSTISGNSTTGSGGGIWSNNGGTLTNVTITGNNPGGVFRSGGPDFVAKNTMIAGNTGAECNTILSSAAFGSNVDEDSSCFDGPMDSIAAFSDLELGPLAFNGGPTRTHSLGSGSWAIDTGTNDGCPDTDQRGATRPFDGNGNAAATCDVGAYEFSPFTFTPTRTDDPAPDGCVPADCSLREAIIAANSATGADTVSVPAGTYTRTLGGSGENASATGDLDITDSVMIAGAGAATSTIDAGDLDRVLDVRGVSSVEISGVTIQNGAGPSGGGVHNGSGTVTITNATLSSNSATSIGGGIYNAFGTVSVTNSTVSGNSAGQGGGIYENNGSLTMANSTVSGNVTTFDGAGLFVFGGASLTNVTITDNNSVNGTGGIESTSIASTAKNTIVADQTGGDPDCNVALITQGNNLDSDDSCFSTGGTDIVNSNPLLGPLASNGGPTQTHALLQGSPAIDAGTNSGTPATDQRGLTRIDGNGDSVVTRDIGAYEANALSINDIHVTEGNSGTTNATFTVSLAAPSVGTTTVDFAAQNGTATAPGDYAAINGTVTFSPGDTSETVTVSVTADTVHEANNNFLVNLSDPSNAVIVDASGTATIGNDDAEPPQPTPTSPSPSPSVTPSVTPTPTPPPPAGCNPNEGDICGTDSDDDLVITTVDDPDGDGVVEVHLGAGDDTVCIAGDLGVLIIVIGTAGDDAVTVPCPGTSRAQAQSSDGPTVIEFRAGAGNDTATTAAGADTLKGGSGADNFSGRRGNDTLKGGKGNDDLKGGRGNDALSGGPNRDECSGGPGKDTTKGCE